MRRIMVFLFLFLLGAGSVTQAETDFQVPKPVGMVNDFAGVMSDSMETDLESKLRKYEQATTTEIAVVTLDESQEAPIEEYSLKIAEAWGVGKKGADNGVLIVNNTADRKVWIEVGYGLEGCLTDLWCGRIIDGVAIPLLREGKYEEAYVAVADTLMKYMGEVSVAEFKARIDAENERKRVMMQEVFMWILTGTASIFAVIAVSFSIGEWRKRRRVVASRRQEIKELKSGFDRVHESFQRLVRSQSAYVMDERLNRYQTSVSAFEAKLSEKLTLLENLMARHADSSTWRRAYQSASVMTFAMSAFVEELESAQDAIDGISDVIENARIALRNANTFVQKEGVPEKRRASLRKQEQALERLVSNIPSRPAPKSFDYLAALATLSDMIAAIASIKSAARTDLAPKPTRRSSSSRRSRSDDDHSGGSYSSSSSSSSSSSFGGFGDGGFGGGGASGSY